MMGILHFVVWQLDPRILLHNTNWVDPRIHATRTTQLNVAACCVNPSPGGAMRSITVNNALSIYMHGKVRL